MPGYIKRIADAMRARGLAAAGGVVIEWPRFCGKTTTAQAQARSVAAFDKDAGIRAIALVAPDEALKGETPRLLDEWQTAPGIWNAARHEIDARGENGQFILTGSAVPADDITRHSGAGRVVRIAMESLTLFELGTSSGEVSVCALFYWRTLGHRSSANKNHPLTLSIDGKGCVECSFCLFIRKFPKPIYSSMGFSSSLCASIFSKMSSPRFKFLGNRFLVLTLYGYSHKIEE